MNRKHISVDILLSTYNGKLFLKGQIDSIIDQTFTQWRLIARDDGSIDSTEDILNRYSKKDPRITLIQDDLGNLGPCQSFAELMKHLTADYVMFCDQDDVWVSEKIERMLKPAISSDLDYPDKPILTVSDLIITDENLNRFSPSSFWKYQGYSPNKKPGFNTIIVQNKFPGCSMMFNRKLVEILKDIPSEAVMHDWWIALIASAFGKISIINEPLVYYRQHCLNRIGVSQNSISGIIRRISTDYMGIFKRVFLNMDFKELRQAQIFRSRYYEMLDDNKKDILDSFCDLSIPGILRNKIFVQPFPLNLRFFFIVLLYKIRALRKY